MKAEVDIQREQDLERYEELLSECEDQEDITFFEAGIKNLKELLGYEV